MSAPLLAALARELERDELLDEGIEAARNACVAGASIAAAAITAAAYYDNPLTGIRALTACMARLSSLPEEVGAWQAAFRRDPGAPIELAPGFGQVSEAQAQAVLAATARLVAAAGATAPPRWLRFWLAQGPSIAGVVGPLNALGLAALAFTDAGLSPAQAERRFLSLRLDTAMEAAALARERGLAEFPFFSEAYHYEGASPPPKSFDRRRLMAALGLESRAEPPPPAASPAVGAPTTDDVATLQGEAAPASSPALHVSAGVAHLGRQVIVHGRDLHHECLGMSFVHYHLFCATGRWFDEARARVLEQLWLCSAYPDARIWCNRIAGYMGSARVDAGLCLSAAVAASNSEAYGFRALARAFELQRAIPEALPERERWLEQMLEQRRTLHGYGRPVRCRDERIPAALHVLASAGVQAGPALKRAFWLEDALGAESPIGLNIAALWAAVALDFGLDPLEYEAFMLLMFAPGYMAVYADQRRRGCLSFLRGHQTRPSPSPEPPAARVKA